MEVFEASLPKATLPTVVMLHKKGLNCWWNDFGYPEKTSMILGKLNRDLTGEPLAAA